MSQGLFGTTFFTLAGMHLLHVLIGLGLLAALGRSAAAAMFWQFVVRVWLVIFAVVYLGVSCDSAGIGNHRSSSDAPRLVVAYLWFLRIRGAGSSLCFFLGVLVLLFDLVSPIDILADKYLFSAHIVQHLVLALVVPPLLIAGMPPLTLPVLPAVCRGASEREPCCSGTFRCFSMPRWQTMRSISYST